MTKEIFEKIYTGAVLDKKDLTPDEKKAVYAVMEECGMSQSTAYLRFFDKGFSEWEVIGVTSIIEKFLANVTPTDGSENDKGYAYTLFIGKDKDIKQFYDIVTSQQLGVKLCDFMAEHGMKSQMTVRSRFKENDWKPWELVGIREIIKKITD